MLQYKWSRLHVMAARGSAAEAEALISEGAAVNEEALVSPSLSLSLSRAEEALVSPSTISSLPLHKIASLLPTHAPTYSCSSPPTLFLPLVRAFMLSKAIC